MFKSILIANRGEIAVRVMRSARAMGVRCIAVYANADRNALHVALADEAIHIGPSAASDSYLCIERIIAAAKQSGAEAIHPGYGFLSENAEFAQAVADASLTFIGPPVEAIRAMGLKDGAKNLMERAGVPVVPGYHGDNQDADFLAEAAANIGYPVLIKARAGGGGKGMRLVKRPDEFAEALKAAQGEAESSFGDDHVLVEKFVKQPRHIEIQVFADSHGNVVHLFERDCSMQRRHQKVIEEAPAPGMSDKLRAAMGQAAIEAARAVGYVGAGTVEFIVEGSGSHLKDDAFWFMEMNTRLQVEHPVSEAITGQDLVEWQLRVAAGEPLPLTQDQLAIDGHAFEARLYAEDPQKDFMPAMGRLEYLHLPDDLARIDAGVREGDEVTPFYDPMLAKIIVHAETRAAALVKLRRALAATRVAGCVTNAGFLLALAQHEDFAAGQLDTGLIARNLVTLSATPAPSGEVLAVAALTAAGFLAPAADEDPFGRKNGWRLWADEQRPVQLLWRQEMIELVVAVHNARRFSVATPGGNIKVAVLQLADEMALLEMSGRIAKVFVSSSSGGKAISVFVDGASYLLQLPDAAAGADTSDAADGRIVAPLPGVIHRLEVAPGDKISTGDRLMVLEAMKMQHSIGAPCDGIVVDLNVAAGDQVSEGDLLLALRKSNAPHAGDEPGKEQA